MTIYQLLPRLWGKGKLSDIKDGTFNHLKSLGVSHLWCTGIIRHATGEDFVKGDAGSPYAISDYYDVNPYLADNPEYRLAEFREFVSRVHDAGLKLIMDFVPNHVAKNYDSSKLPLFDWCDYDWTDTRKINYSADGAYEKMLDILRFWAEYGVDGFRCDMVELVPVDFFSWAIRTLKQDYPDLIFIAEVYEKYNYRRYIEEAGFDFLYDKSGLYDTLRGIVLSGGTARGITWNWQFLGDMQPHMLNFLENHDEERFPFASGCSAALAASALLNTAPFMIYFGEEIGVDASESDNKRTTIFNFAKIDGLQRLYSYAENGSKLTPAEKEYLDGFRFVTSLAAEPVVTKGLIHDLCYCNESTPGFNPDRHFAFLRHYGESTVIVFCNFDSFPASLELNIPDLGFRCPPTRIDAASGEAVIVKVS